MPFGRDTPVIPGNVVLDSPGPPQEGEIWWLEPPVLDNAACHQITLAVVGCESGRVLSFILQGSRLLAHRDSMLLAVRNTVIISGWMLPYIRRARQPTQLSQLFLTHHGCMVAACYHQSVMLSSFSALMLLVRQPEGHPAYKKYYRSNFQKYTFGDWPNLEQAQKMGRLNKNQVCVLLVLLVLLLLLSSLGSIAESDSLYCNRCYHIVIHLLGVSPSVTLAHPAKTIGQNEMPFGRDTRVVPSNIVLYKGPSPPQEGRFGGSGSHSKSALQIVVKLLQIVE